MFTKWSGKDVVIAQVYVDEIIYGSTYKKLAKDFQVSLAKEFEIKNVGELKFFLGLQIQQHKDGIYLSQKKYARDLVTRFGLDKSSPKLTPMPTTGKLHRDEK